MDGEQFISNKSDGVEFREIVLNHLSRILQISSEELRIKETFVKTAQGYVERIGTEDTRKSYIQAIEALAIVLLPYFDEKMNEVYQEKTKIMNAWKFQLEKILEKEIKEIKEQSNEENLPKSFYVDVKVNSARELFKELNLLLNRQEYLKGAVFGEAE